MKLNNLLIASFVVALFTLIGGCGSPAQPAVVKPTVKISAVIKVDPDLADAEGKFEFQTGRRVVLEDRTVGHTILGMATRVFMVGQKVTVGSRTHRFALVPVPSDPSVVSDPITVHAVGTKIDLTKNDTYTVLVFEPGDQSLYPIAKSLFVKTDEKELARYRQAIRDKMAKPQTEKSLRDSSAAYEG